MCMLIVFATFYLLFIFPVVFKRISADVHGYPNANFETLKAVLVVIFVKMAVFSSCKHGSFS